MIIATLGSILMALSFTHASGKAGVRHLRAQAPCATSIWMSNKGNDRRAEIYNDGITTSALRRADRWREIPEEE
jgi:hypothetical protein